MDEWILHSYMKLQLSHRALSSTDLPWIAFRAPSQSNRSNSQVVHVIWALVSWCVGQRSLGKGGERKSRMFFWVVVLSFGSMYEVCTSAKALELLGLVWRDETLACMSLPPQDSQALRPWGYSYGVCVLVLRHKYSPRVFARLRA